jgi:hypothetical protein
MTRLRTHCSCTCSSKSNVDFRLIESSEFRHVSGCPQQQNMTTKYQSQLNNDIFSIINFPKSREMITT